MEYRFLHFVREKTYWHTSNQQSCLFPEKAKPKSKKKEEPSSLFQRQRVDTLLLDLRSKFPPTFYQVCEALTQEAICVKSLQTFLFLLSQNKVYWSHCDLIVFASSIFSRSLARSLSQVWSWISLINNTCKTQAVNFWSISICYCRCLINIMKMIKCGHL